MSSPPQNVLGLKYWHRITLNGEVFDKTMLRSGLFVLSNAHVIPTVLEGDTVEEQLYGNIFPIGPCSDSIQFLKSLQVLADGQWQSTKVHLRGLRPELEPGQVFKCKLVGRALQRYVLLLSGLTLRLKINFKAS